MRLQAMRLSNNSMQRTAPRHAADPSRQADRRWPRDRARSYHGCAKDLFAMSTGSPVLHPSDLPGG